MAEDSADASAGALQFEIAADKPRTQPEIAEWRRKHLLIATIHCIAELGMQNATVEEITRRARVSRGLIRHYFGGKSELVTAACRFLCSLFREQIERPRDGDLSPRARLRTLLDATFRPPWFNEVSVSAWFSFWAAARTDVRLRAVYGEYYDWYRSHVRRLFLELAATRPLPIPLDPAVDGFVAQTDGLWLEIAIDPTKHPPDYAAAVNDAYLELLFGAE